MQRFECFLLLKLTNARIYYFPWKKSAGIHYKINVVYSNCESEWCCRGGSMKGFGARGIQIYVLVYGCVRRGNAAMSLHALHAWGFRIHFFVYGCVRRSNAGMSPCTQYFRFVVQFAIFFHKTSVYIVCATCSNSDNMPPRLQRQKSTGVEELLPDMSKLKIVRNSIDLSLRYFMKFCLLPSQRFS